MTMRWLRVLLALAFVFSTATAEAELSGARTGLFDNDGRPTERARKLFEKQILPAQVLRGVDIPIMAVDSKGKWKPIEDGACVSVAYRVTAEGKVDKLSLLESRPDETFSAAALEAISQWQFTPTKNSWWAVLPISFGFARSQHDNTASRIKRPFAGVVDDEKCVDMSRKKETVFAQGFDFSAQPDPVYPKADFLRTHGAACVTIAFRIGADGSPTDLDLLEAKPDTSYVDVAALEVQAWRLGPSSASAAGMPAYGFVRFGYAVQRDDAIPQCMEASFAAKHYKPSEGAQ